jgi:iron(II)-dependent oxidoreductase
MKPEENLAEKANQFQRVRDLVLTSDQATSAGVLSAWVRDARSRTMQLVSDLDDQQLMVPKLATINPLLWEIGHAAWFQEHWVLQHAAGQQPIHANGEQLFDSIGIEHEVRWNLPMPPRDYIFRYNQQVCDAVLELLNTAELTDRLRYFIKLSVFHEDMHTEAYTYTRQTLALPAPDFEGFICQPNDSEGWTSEDETPRDVELSGGQFLLGATPGAAFVFDNEKWTHPVSVPPFAISRTAVSQQQFAAFVEDQGYFRRELWSDEGWQWRQTKKARHPVYWRRDGDGWLRRHFDQFLPLEPRLPVIHVNWFEAEAYCRWANRRLPTEAEWEFAAAASDPQSTGASAAGKTDLIASSNDATAIKKRHYPWGEKSPELRHANMNWQAMGPVDVAAHRAGDTPLGCRQMIGNVWEWTATTFNPFPGFVPDPYKEYSRPSFGNCKVLRGGCWATRSRLIRNTWRNYYQPIRRDVLAGFRTCAP